MGKGGSCLHTVSDIPPPTYHLRHTIYRPQDFIQETLLRQGPFDRETSVDQGFGNGVDAISGRPFRKLRSLDGVCADVVILDRELIGEAHGPRTVRSSGSNEDFEVERCVQLGKFSPARGEEAGIPLGDRKNSVE